MSLFYLADLFRSGKVQVRLLACVYPLRNKLRSEPVEATSVYWPTSMSAVGIRHVAASFPAVIV